MKAQFLELRPDDRRYLVNLRADVLDDAGQTVASVARLAPSPGVFGDKGERRYVCSCWKCEGLIARREDCAHIACVEEAVAAAAARPVV